VRATDTAFRMPPAPRTLEESGVSGDLVLQLVTNVEALLETELRPRGVALRGCQPRDLIDHAVSLAAYLDRPRELTLPLLAEAAGTYFVHDGDVTLA
jgi:hypothetical protein